jgi:hypothetical protein
MGGQGADQTTCFLPTSLAPRAQGIAIRTTRSTEVAGNARNFGSQVRRDGTSRKRPLVDGPVARLVCEFGRLALLSVL